MLKDFSLKKIEVRFFPTKLQ